MNKKNGKVEENAEEESLLNYNTKFLDNVLTKEELPKIRDLVVSTNKYDNIVFYLKACMRFGKMKDAMEFADNQIDNKELTIEEQNKIIKLKRKIQELNNKYMAISILKKGQGVQQAVKYSGLTLEEVMILDKKLQSKIKRVENKEEDDNDEISL